MFRVFTGLIEVCATHPLHTRIEVREYSRQWIDRVHISTKAVAGNWKFDKRLLTILFSRRIAMLTNNEIESNLMVLFISRFMD